MLDWLKPILGDNYTEEIDKQVSQHVGKNFVSKTDFNNLNETKKAQDSQITEMTTAIEGLKANGADVENLNKQIEDLQKQVTDTQTAADEKIADMAFNGLITESILSQKGRNEKIIRTLLDVKTLKASKNQQADILAAVTAVKESESYLFESEEQSGTGMRMSTGLMHKTDHGAGDDDGDDAFIAAAKRGAGIKTGDD